MVLSYSDLEHAAQVLQSAPDVDGFVLQPKVGPVPVSLLALLREKARAVVVEGLPMEGVDVDAVVTNWRGCVEMALGHLRGLGHERIALAASGSPDAPWLRQASQHRELLAKWSGQGTMPLLTAPGSDELESLLREQLTHDKTVTGLIVWGYANAVSVLAVLRELGLQVGRDISLVMIENPDLNEPELAGLTTVGRTRERIAERVMETLQARWANPQTPYQTAYDPPELVERGS